MNNKDTKTWNNLRNVILFINYDNKIQNKGKTFLIKWNRPSHNKYERNIKVFRTQNRKKSFYLLS